MYNTKLVFLNQPIDLTGVSSKFVPWSRYVRAVGPLVSMLNPSTYWTLGGAFSRQ
jgi:hypothetical protein